MKIDGNAPHAVGAGLKPAQPFEQDAAIFIPLCGLHKATVTLRTALLSFQERPVVTPEERPAVILRSAATKNLRPLHTRRAIEEKTTPNCGRRFGEDLSIHGD